MKRRGLFCFYAVALFLLTACTPKPNMETLLSYQSPGTELVLRITDTEVFSAKLTIEKNETAIVFTDEKREGISYRMDRNGQIYMFFDDVLIPLAPSDELKCKDWFALFAIPSGDNIWKIKHETLGGIDVYACRDEKITLYIDAASGLPLKIEAEGIVIDVLEAHKKSADG